MCTRSGHGHIQFTQMPYRVPGTFKGGIFSSLGPSEDMLLKDRVSGTCKGGIFSSLGPLEDLLLIPEQDRKKTKYKYR